MQRILSLDLARGFTVLVMPSIHVVMLYSLPAVQQSLLGDILTFIAEGPGAQLFMLLMGVSFVFSSGINQRSVLQRTFLLLIAAYLLNFFKFIVPLGLGLMPENLLSELRLKNDFRAAVFLFLLGDILHFAAIAYLTLFFVFSFKHYPLWSALIAIAIIFLSPLAWDMKSGIIFIDYLLQLLGGHPPNVFFPVFPWLVYPMMGLCLGFFLKHSDTKFVFINAGWLGAVFMIGACLFPPTPATEWLSFYRTQPADTIFHAGFVLSWLGVVHWLSRHVAANPFFALLVFCSRNITAIYIIQWIIIFWCMAF